MQALVQEEKEKQKLECNGDEKANTNDLDNASLKFLASIERKTIAMQLSPLPLQNK